MSKDTLQAITNMRCRFTAFAEAFGLGGYGSLNVDVALQGSSHVNPHLRVGYWDDRLTHSETTPYTLIAIPVEVGVLIGETHMFEFNLGYAVELPVQEDANPGYYDDFTSIVAWIGYRYQRRAGGLFGKIGLSSPFTSTEAPNGGTVHVESTAGYWFGLGLGYTFKPKKKG